MQCAYLTRQHQEQQHTIKVASRARSCIPMATPVHAHELCPQPSQRDGYAPDSGWHVFRRLLVQTTPSIGR